MWTAERFGHGKIRKDLDTHEPSAWKKLWRGKFGEPSGANKNRKPATPTWEHPGSSVPLSEDAYQGREAVRLKARVP